MHARRTTSTISCVYQLLGEKFAQLNQPTIELLFSFFSLLRSSVAMHVATVDMCHSSEGRLQRQRPVKPVATDER
jgi:hypothetical protein